MRTIWYSCCLSTERSSDWQTHCLAIYKFPSDKILIKIFRRSIRKRMAIDLGEVCLRRLFHCVISTSYFANCRVKNSMTAGGTHCTLAKRVSSFDYHFSIVRTSAQLPATRSNDNYGCCLLLSNWSYKFPWISRTWHTDGIDCFNFSNLWFLITNLFTF